MNPWPIVLAGLRRSFAQALALALLIAVAVGLGLAVQASERALRRGAAQAADAFDLMIGAPGSAAQLILTAVYLQPAPLDLIPGDVLTRLQADPGVAFAAPIGFGDVHRGHPVVGTTRDLVTRGGTLAPVEGRLFARADEVMVGAALDLPLGYRFHPSHGGAADPDADDDDDHDSHGHEHAHEHAHEHKEIDYVVVGRMAPTGTPWDRAILAPIEAVWWIHGLDTGHAAGRGSSAIEAMTLGPPFDGPLGPVPAIVVKPRSVADAYRLRQAWRGHDTAAVFSGEVLAQIFRTLGDARDILALIAILAQGLVLTAVMLAAFAALEGRRRTLAVLRALGASRLYVFVCVWLHVGIIVAAGAALGLILGLGATWGLGAAVAAKTGVAVPLAIRGADLGYALVLPLLAALAASLPARALCRRPVAEGLSRA